MIELLVVLAFIGLLVGPKVIKRLSPSRTTVPAPAPAAPGAPAAPAAAAAPAPATSSSNKRWWIGGGILLLIGAGLLWFFPQQLQFNWADTTPGKAIEKSLGTGWANWVMWIILAVIVIGLINFFMGDRKGSKMIAALNTGIILVWMVVLFTGIVKHFTTQDPTKATELEVVRLDFSPMPPGAVVEFHMLTNGLVIAKKRITQPKEVPIHICFRVKNALADQTEFVVVADSFSTDHLRLSPESVQILTANNINMVRVVAALVQTYDQNPCK